MSFCSQTLGQSWDKVGTKFDDYGTKFVEISTKCNPGVIKYRSFYDFFVASDPAHIKGQPGPNNHILQ